LFWREVTSVSRRRPADHQVLVRNGDPGDVETLILDTALPPLPDRFWAVPNRLVTNRRL
jgi:hypothetical protein